MSPEPEPDPEPEPVDKLVNVIVKLKNSTSSTINNSNYLTYAYTSGASSSTGTETSKAMTSPLSAGASFTFDTFQLMTPFYIHDCGIWSSYLLGWKFKGTPNDIQVTAADVVNTDTVTVEFEILPTKGVDDDADDEFKY